MSRLLRLYHALPAPLRSAAASLRGAHLRRWRYGPETEGLVAAALERESWSAGQWSKYREERLSFVLERAATRVPYYREYWRAHARAPGKPWRYLENWPVLEKQVVRSNPLAFLADDCSPRRMFCERTSGTTGNSTRLWWSRDTVRGWYALFDARCRRWYGVSRRDRWAIIGGQLVTPVSSRRPPFWVWNAPLRQLYISAWHLAPDLVPPILDAIDRYAIRHLFGYSSALYTLARIAREVGWRPRNGLRAAVTNAEPLYPHQREVIAAAFECPVRMTYGMTEIVATATECELGNLHLWDEVGWVEVVGADGPVPGGTAGDLVCTGLFNTDMPLVRYRVGDRGTLAPAGATCGCGRTLSLMHSVEGRIDDVVYTVDGREVGQLQSVFQADVTGIREAQLVQVALDRICVRYVPTDAFSRADEDVIRSRLRARLGDVTVVFEARDEIPRTANGKFRYVLSEIPRPQRGALN